MRQSFRAKAQQCWREKPERSKDTRLNASPQACSHMHDPNLQELHGLLTVSGALLLCRASKSIPRMNKKRQLMIVAGEPSGDAHAADLVRALRATEPHAQWEFFGATGPLLRAADVKTTVSSDDLAVMGIWEVGRVFARFWRAFEYLKQAALENKPDAVVLVDWPEFNLRLARALHRNGIKVIYYISPQPVGLAVVSKRKREKGCRPRAFNLALRKRMVFNERY